MVSGAAELTTRVDALLGVHVLVRKLFYFLLNSILHEVLALGRLILAILLAHLASRYGHATAVLGLAHLLRVSLSIVLVLQLQRLVTLTT